MEILLKLVLAILGIALYTAFKARIYILSPKKAFHIDLLVSDNIRSWAWALLLVFIITAILVIEPSASEAIKALTGLDLENTKTGFLALGIALAAFSKNVKK